MNTPNRPPLSPAAQAVMDAANGASSWGPDDCLNDAREIAAAALRAVIEHIKVCNDGPIHYPNPYGEGLRDRERNIVMKLDCIAAELEGQQ